MKVSSDHGSLLELRMMLASVVLWQLVDTATEAP